MPFFSAPKPANHQKSSVTNRAAATLLAASLVGSLALALPTAAHAAPAPAASPLTNVLLEDVSQTASSVETTIGDPCNGSNLAGAGTCGNATTLSYGNGPGKRLVSFTADGNTFTALPADSGESYAEVFRVNNGQVSGVRDNIFLARATEATAFGTIENSDPGSRSMADIFTSDIVTEGSDNTFVNAGSTNTNNIERISFLRSTPIVSLAPNRIGLTLLERGGNDDVKVAAVLSVDGDGNPTSWGGLVTIASNSGAWGTVIDSVPSTVFRRDAASMDQNYRPTDKTGPQTLSGMYISFADLGIAAGTPVYGVSLLPTDATAPEVTPENQILNSPTSGSWGNNGIDLIGGIFVSTAPPSAADDSSTGAQGAPQVLDIVGTPGDSRFPINSDATRLISPTGGSVNTSGTVVTVPEVGTYSLDRSSSTVVFQPTPTFVGTAPVITYRVVDTRDDTAEGTLSPTVTPVAVPDTTTGPQGLSQTSDVVATDTAPGVVLDRGTLILLDSSGDPATTVAVLGEGSYAIDVDMNVVFTPEPQFVGTATPLRYQVRDEAGNTIESTYTPTVTADADAEITPIDLDGTPATTPDTDSARDDETAPDAEPVETRSAAVEEALAFTGSTTTTGLVAGGGLLLLIGSALVLANRARRQEPTS